MTVTREDGYVKHILIGKPRHMLSFITQHSFFSSDQFNSTAPYTGALPFISMAICLVKEVFL